MEEIETERIKGLSQACQRAWWRGSRHASPGTEGAATTRPSGEDEMSAQE